MVIFAQSVTPNPGDLERISVLVDGCEAIAPNLALLLDESADHLRNHAGRQSSVLAAFEEASDDDLRISMGRHAYEPAILLVFFCVLFRMFNGDHLRRAGFTSEVDAGEMCARGG